MKPARAIRPELHRRGFAAIVLIACAIIFIAGLFFAAQYYKNYLYKKAANGLQYDYNQTNSPFPAIKTYETQKECENATGKSCTILMCDVVPEGKTFEETCGVGFKTGWAPSKSNSNLQPSSPNETTNWKTIAGDGFEFKYPPDWKQRLCDTGVIILNETEFFVKNDECHSDPSSTLWIGSINNISPSDKEAQKIPVKINSLDVFKIVSPIYGNYNLVKYYVNKSNDELIVFSYLKQEIDISQLIEKIISTIEFKDSR